MPHGKIKNKKNDIKTTDYKPGGLNKGKRLKMPSTSIGNPIALLRTGEVDVFPFQVLNHGPPPTSRAAMSLVASNMICHSPNIHEHVPSNTKYGNNFYV